MAWQFSQNDTCFSNQTKREKKTIFLNGQNERLDAKRRAKKKYKNRNSDKQTCRQRREQHTCLLLTYCEMMFLSSSNG